MQNLMEGFQSFENQKEKNILRALVKYGALDSNSGVSANTLADAMGINPKFILTPITQLKERGMVNIESVPDDKNFLGNVAISITSTGQRVQEMID